MFAIVNILIEQKGNKDTNYCLCAKSHTLSLSEVKLTQSRVQSQTYITVM